MMLHLGHACINNAKINNTFIFNSEDLHIVMPMHNLLEYSNNYSMTPGTLRNYYRDKVNDGDNDNDAAASYRIFNNKRATSKCFQYKTELKGSTPDNSSRLDTKVVIPLKYFSNCWKLIDLLSINCEIECGFPRSRNFVISEISRTAAVAGNLGANLAFPTREATLEREQYFK